MAVDQGHDVRVMETLQDIDFGRKVFFEFLIELRQVHGLDSNIGLRSLYDKNESVSISRHLRQPGMTHRMNTLVDCCKATSPDLIESRIATDGHFGS